MQEDPMVNSLQQIKEVLDEHGIEFWLDCGTLLGAVRDGKFLPWEHDIDLGAWDHHVSDDLKISISKELCSKGFKVYTSHLLNNMNIAGKGVFSDINFYHLNDDKAVWFMLGNPIYKFFNYFAHVLLAPYEYGIHLYKNKSLAERFIRQTTIMISRAIPSFLRNQLAQILEGICVNSGDISWVVPSFYFSHLSALEFYEMTLRVPTKAEEYLSYRYGKDWQVPKQDWVTARDDGTVIKPSE